MLKEAGVSKKLGAKTAALNDFGIAYVTSYNTFELFTDRMIALLLTVSARKEYTKSHGGLVCRPLNTAFFALT